MFFKILLKNIVFSSTNQMEFYLEICEHHKKKNYGMLISLFEHMLKNFDDWDSEL